MFRRFLSFLPIAAFVLCLATGTASAATRFVATTGSDEAGNTCAVSSSPCRTVQQAVAQAEAGDTVSIASGTYEGLFKLNKELTFVGQGSSTLLQGEPTVQRPVFISSSVTLKDLRVRGGLSGSAAQDAVFIGGPGIGVTFDHVVAEQDPSATSGRNAVYVGEGDSLTMKESTISAVGSTGLWVNGTVTLTGSTVAMAPQDQGGSALRVLAGATAELSGTNVTNSTGGRLRGSALAVEGGAVTATDSIFTAGDQAILASGGTLSLVRDRLRAYETGLLLVGARAELRDSQIVPPPGDRLVFGGERVRYDILVQNRGAPVTSDLTIVGSTLYANGVETFRPPRAILAQSAVRARIVNSILRAATEGSGEAADIETEGGGTWDVTYSTFKTVIGDGPVPGSPTNFAVDPALDPNFLLTSADGFLLGAGDPTQLLSGETDLSGHLRGSFACSGAPDIGAEEFLRAPCPSPPAPPVSGGGEQPAQPSSSAGPVPPGQKKPVKPILSHVKLENRRRMPTLKFQLNEPARVTIAVSKVVDASARKGKKATDRPLARFTIAADVGRSSVPLGPHLQTAGAPPASIA